jgi:pimeloyl-ACP methyl ester carboxylesterase
LTKPSRLLSDRGVAAEGDGTLSFSRCPIQRLNSTQGQRLPQKACKQAAKSATCRASARKRHGVALPAEGDSGDPFARSLGALLAWSPVTGDTAPVQAETRYAMSGDVSIAYQVVGEGGPIDIVFAHGFVANLEVAAENPRYEAFFQRLAELGRVIRFDRRGMGLSDRVREVPTLETRMDVRTVMDAAGSPRAATVLSEEEEARWIEQLPARWGSRELAAEFLRTSAPTIADDPKMQDWLARVMRLGASPGAAALTSRMAMTVDIRDVLPSIRVPTLVLNRDFTRGEATYISERIPYARRVEIGGPDTMFWLAEGLTMRSSPSPGARGVSPSPIPCS